MFVYGYLCMPLYMPTKFYLYYLYFTITYVVQYNLYLETVYFEKKRANNFV